MSDSMQKDLYISSNETMHSVEILQKRHSFKKTHASAIKNLTIDEISRISHIYNLDKVRIEKLNDFIVDAVAVMKIGRTDTERLIYGRQKGRKVVIDPLEQRWENAFRNTNHAGEIVKVIQDASIKVVNILPKLS